MTPAELRTDTLLELGVIAAGEAPSGEDSQAVDDEYAKLHAELQARDYLWWNSDDDIPDEVARPITLLMAHRLSRKYGKNEITRQRLEWDAEGYGNRNSAMANLASIGNTGVVLNTDYTHY